MSATGRLARAWATQHRGRSLLTAAAVALAASLVVFTVTGYRAAIERTGGFARQVLGPFDIVVLPRFAIEPNIDTGLDAQLQTDMRVDRLSRARVAHGDIEDVRNATYYESWRTTFIGLQVDEAPMAMRDGAWLDPQASRFEGVVSGGLAHRWQVGVGDELPVDTEGGHFRVTVVGITEEHLAHGRASGVFVLPERIGELAGREYTADRLYLALREGADSRTFVEEWRGRLAESDPPVQVHDLQEIAAELGADRAIKRLRGMGAAAAVIAFLAAAFIIYATASAGTGERRRQLAVLRLIGATRGQVMATVLKEYLGIALVGCLLGVPFGWLCLQVLAVLQPTLFSGGIAPDIGGALAAVLATSLATLAAAWLPARAAGRTPPIDALAQAAGGDQTRIGVWRSLIGGLALLLTVSLCIWAPLGSKTQVIGLFLVNVISLVVAGLLLTPLCLVAIERLASPMLATLAGVPPALVRQQLSSRLARSAGTVLTLAICLGLSITMNVWGRTMVVPFMPSPQLPDVVISIMPAGLPPAVAEEVRSAPGVQGDRVLPMLVEQSLLGPELLAKTGGQVDKAWIQLIGADPDRALLGERPLLPLALSDLTAAEASLALQEPMTCLVPPSFADAFGLQVGDELGLMAPGDASRETRLRIVGLAALPGWHWVTKLSRMRTLGGKPQAPILLSNATAQQLGITRVRHWFVDTEDSFDRMVLRQDLQVLAERHAGEYESAHFGPGMARGVSVKAVATGAVADLMNNQAGKVIWVLGALPLASLLVAVLGVANAIAMGVRARSWEFGVLRAIGLEARQARRLVLVEAGLLALAAAVLSLVFGLLAARAGIAVGMLAYNTGGGVPGLVLPWIDIGIAIGITSLVAGLAALVPAVRLARREPMDLLQAGRG